MNPKYISVNGIDTLKISFYNTTSFMKPKNEELGSIPDGYTLTIKVPPQGENLMTTTELK